MAFGSSSSSPGICTSSGCYIVGDGHGNGEQVYRDRDTGERYIPVISSSSASVLGQGHGRRGMRGDTVVVSESLISGHGHCKACDHDRDRDRDRRRYGNVYSERVMSPHYYTVTEGDERNHVHSGRGTRSYSYGTGGQRRYERAYYGRGTGSHLDGIYYVH